jgi:hypothetical protein
MPAFGKKSTEKLATCDQRLQDVLNEVVKHFDCSILCGHRGKEEQNEAYHSGRSKLKFPKSKHNGTPSKAVDVAPYPIDWNDINRFHYFAGFVVGIAASKGITLRYGGDWDRDTQLKDNNFNDLPHFEIVE